MPLVAHERVARTGAVAVVAAITLSVLLAPLGEPWRTGVAGVVAVLLIALGSPHGALDHLVLLAGRAPRAGTGTGTGTGIGIGTGTGIGIGIGIGIGGADRAVGTGEAHRKAPTTPQRWAGHLRSLTAAFEGLSARFVVGYVAVALVSLAGYLVAPRAGFALFLVLSVAHFAAGEAGVAVERGLARGWWDPLAWVAALGGAVIVVLPLSSREAGVALAAVDPRLAPVLSPLPLVADGVTVLGVLAILACIAAAARGDHRASTVAVELAALTALAALAHPLIAFAAFFAFWHALRHQARLAQVLRGASPGPRPQHVGRPLREVLDSALPGVPATVGVLVGAVVLGLTGATLLGGLLAVIWALTVPHSIAVAVLEVRAARERAGAGAGAGTGGPSGSQEAVHGTGIARPASNDHDTPPLPGAGARGAAAPADRLRG